MEMYPKMLRFVPKLTGKFEMSLSRPCICPLVVSKGGDQVAISTKFELRKDASVLRNYANLVIEMSNVVPDGIVCFFPSYSYMELVVSTWSKMGLLNKMLQNKLLFVETPNYLETSFALLNYRKVLLTPLFHSI